MFGGERVGGQSHGRTQPKRFSQETEEDVSTHDPIVIARLKE